MADEQVLKSFLVSLGFKTDQQSQKSMLRTVVEVTASLRNLAAVAVAATAAAGAAIAKMASDLDELYYSSKRIGSSANEIKAFGHAVGQLGGSAEGAVASLENLARNIRQSPGYIGLLRRLGVQTHDSAGNMRDMTVQMVELGEQLRKMPTHLAYQFADLLGIDEKTLLAMREGVGEFSDEYKALLAATGNDLDGSARDAHEVMQTWRTSWAITGLLITKITSSILKALQPLAKAFNSNVGGMARAADKFISFLSRMVRRVYQLIQDINALVAKFWEPLRQVIDWIAAKFDSMGEHGRAALLGIRDGAILAAAAIALFLAPITTISAALLLLYDDWKTYKEGGLFSLPWDELEKRWNHMGDTIANVGKTIKEWFTAQLEAASKALDDLYQLASKFWSGGGKEMTEKTTAAASGSATAQAVPAAPAAAKPPATPAKPAQPAATAPKPAPAKPAPSTAGSPAQKIISEVVRAGQEKLRVYRLSSGDTEERSGGSVSWRNNNPGNLKFEFSGSADKTVKSKRTKEQALAAARSRYSGVVDLDAYGNAIFASEALGRAAKEKLLRSSHKNKTVEEMLKGYAVDDYSGKANTSAYAKHIFDLAKSRGLDLKGKKISEMSQPEIDALMDGIKKVEGFKEGSIKTTPGLPGPAQSNSSGTGKQAAAGGVTINQSTTVNVTGATDPSATATAVSGAQTQVNQQLARNARSALVG